MLLASNSFHASVAWFCSRTASFLATMVLSPSVVLQAAADRGHDRHDRDGQGDLREQGVFPVGRLLAACSACSRVSISSSGESDIFPYRLVARAAWAAASRAIGTRYAEQLT